LIDQAQGARHWTAVASTVHGWEKSEDGEGVLNVNVLAGRTRIAIETNDA
jgi:hypothetical protein